MHKGEITSGSNERDQRPSGAHVGSSPVVGTKLCNELDRRGCVVQQGPGPTGTGKEPVDEAKAVQHPKRGGLAGLQTLKANRGAAGVDSIDCGWFEADLSNKPLQGSGAMCSGATFPPPCGEWRISKADGGMRSGNYDVGD